MKLGRMRILILVCLAVVPVALLAQAGSSAGGRRSRIYDPNSEVTVNGTVEDVISVPGRRGFSGTHLLVKSNQGTIEVHVGPASYIEHKQFAFAKGDTVEVTGSKVVINGKDALIAREIKKAGNTLALRDAAGIPYWSRGAYR